jgi:protein-S-isoprenylcysteine O-methyltransferase Ste14
MAMTIYIWLIFALWLALIACWVFSAQVLDRGAQCRWLWWREVAVRLGFFALVVFVLQAAATNHYLSEERLYTLGAGALPGLTGLALCTSGIGLAILARFHLQRSPELVTSGPYTLVRHPLYGGLMLAMLGSALAQSLLWLLPLIVYTPLFILSARREESLLLAKYPGRYADYRRRTKMLVPFVL